MTNIEYVLSTLEYFGRQMAMSVQIEAYKMSGTELNAEKDYLPLFSEAVKQQNMKNRRAGLTDGFVCKSSAGRVVRLLQNYDSEVFTQEPEELPAQWGFVWSTNPEDALPFVAISTSPYNKGECCTEDGRVYRSKINTNVYAPSAYLQGWEEVVNKE